MGPRFAVPPHEADKVSYLVTKRSRCVSRSFKCYPQPLEKEQNTFLDFATDLRFLTAEPDHPPPP